MTGLLILAGLVWAPVSVAVGLLLAAAIRRGERQHRRDRPHHTL